MTLQRMTSNAQRQQVWAHKIISQIGGHLVCPRKTYQNPSGAINVGYTKGGPKQVAANHIKSSWIGCTKL